MNLIAIDGGWSGCIAYRTHKVIGIRDCPGDVTGMRDLIKMLKTQHQEEWYAYLEANSPSPHFGARGNFGLGMNIGTWEGILTSADIPFENINPKTWQKFTNNEKSRHKKGRLARKEKAWRMARKLYPQFHEELGDNVPNPRDIQQGRADALCLLEYIRRIHG